MSKRCAYWLGLGAALLLGSPVAAQVPGPPHRTCGTQEAAAFQQAQLLRQLPGYDPAEATNAAQAPLRTAATTYTLPVIVHVIHSGEALGVGTNLSQAQVNSQLDVLNEDYRNLNADGATVVPAAFQPVRGDVQLQFVLATRDPSGNALAEPGIDRVSGPTQGFAAAPYSVSYIESLIKPRTSWNPEQYINIWVINLGQSLLGYAQFPDNTAGLSGLSTLGGSAATDGVVILYSAFGRTGTLISNYNRGRTLTHELGHFFGLRHVWGDSNCGNDYVGDTPTQQTYNFGCPSFPHVTCSNGPSGDEFMNYLDYVDDACMAMFSGGQKDRMQAVLAAGTPRRSNLAHSPALCPTSALAAIGGGTSTCAGASLTLSAASLAHLSASPYTYAWTLVSGDGLPAATTAPTLTVTPTQSSVYRLTLGLPGQSCTASATLAVAVLPAVWTGAAGDGNWFTAGNWQGCVPTRTTDATIPAGLATPYPTIAGGTAEVRTLTQPGSLAITGGELDLYGDFFTGAGTFSHTGGQVVAMGTGGQALRSGTYYDLAIAGTGNKTIPTATITNRLLMQGGVLSTVTVNSTQGLVTLTPTATLVGENDNSFVLGAIQTTRTVGTTPEAFGNLGARIMASFAPGATTVLRTTDQSQPLGAAQRISRYYDIAATTGGGLQGATLALAYLPHELNGLAPDQLTLLKSTTGGATWTNEGATTRDASAGLVTRAYATSLNGRWTLAPASSGLAPAAVAYAIQAYPVPFTTGGLSLQVTTPTAGPLTVQLYDAAGRAILNQAVADVEVGTSTINLTNSELLAPGKYIVRVQQAAQRLTLNVVRE